MRSAVRSSIAGVTRAYTTSTPRRRRTPRGGHRDDAQSSAIGLGDPRWDAAMVMRVVEAVAGQTDHVFALAGGPHPSA